MEGKRRSAKFLDFVFKAEESGGERSGVDQFSRQKNAGGHRFLNATVHGRRCAVVVL